MDRLDKIFPAAIGAVLLPIFEFFYGQGDVVKYTVAALIVFIALDWISGSRASKKDSSYSSKYGIDGVFRTFFMLLLPSGGHFIDKAFGIPSIIFGLIIAGLLRHTIESATANAIRAGWGRWIPKKILDWLVKRVQCEIDSKMSRAQIRIERKNPGQRVNGEE